MIINTLRLALLAGTGLSLQSCVLSDLIEAQREMCTTPMIVNTLSVQASYDKVAAGQDDWCTARAECSVVGAIRSANYCQRYGAQTIVLPAGGLINLGDGFPVTLGDDGPRTVLAGSAKGRLTIRSATDNPARLRRPADAKETSVIYAQEGSALTLENVAFEGGEGGRLIDAEGSLTLDGVSVRGTADTSLIAAAGAFQSDAFRLKDAQGYATLRLRGPGTMRDTRLESSGDIRFDVSQSLVLDGTAAATTVTGNESLAFRVQPGASLEIAGLNATANGALRFIAPEEGIGRRARSGNADIDVEDFRFVDTGIVSLSGRGFNTSLDLADGVIDRFGDMTLNSVYGSATTGIGLDRVAVVNGDTFEAYAGAPSEAQSAIRNTTFARVDAVNITVSGADGSPSSYRLTNTTFAETGPVTLTSIGDSSIGLFRSVFHDLRGPVACSIQQSEYPDPNAAEPEYGNFLSDSVASPGVTYNATCQLTTLATDPLLTPEPGARFYVPAPGSLLIDAGGPSCFAADQRGLPRPVGSACDIGAVEAQ